VSSLRCEVVNGEKIGIVAQDTHSWNEGDLFRAFGCSRERGTASGGAPQQAIVYRVLRWRVAELELEAGADQRESRRLPRVW